MSSKATIISSLIWKFLERIGIQGTQFVVSIVLARLLAPENFGLIAIVTIIISIANVFIQSGLGTALIQKKDADNLDFSSVFYASLSLATIIYTGIFFTTPLIAQFYNNDELIPIIRVLTLTLFIGVFSSIQYAYVARNMMFKKLFFRSMGSIIPSSIVGISLAFAGFGVWALVAQQLFSASLSVIILWFTVPWRPRLSFSFQRLGKLFSFGWKLLLSSILDTIYSQIQGIVIGKMFSPTSLAFYDRGSHFPYIIVNNINNSIQAVMLPSLAAYQDDRPQVKKMMRRAIVTSSFLIIPMMAGLAAIAEPLVLVLLGEKWLPCVPFVRIFCFFYAFYPIHTSNLSAINALGRSDIFLKLEIIKKIYGLAILIGFIFYFRSPIGIAYGAALSALIASFVNASPNKKLLNYSYFEQLKDIAPSILLTCLMTVVISSLTYLHLNNYITIILQITVGCIIYLGLAKILHFECLDYLIKTVAEFKRKHGK
ncbi:MAG: lipopolysaccharide biosynthesis protein [Fibrobacter sp.]|nr:lipopolysaccharide biosynthesis protein [Fibrobacter sp.]